MPQFDLSSFNVQLFWLFISFFAYYFIYTGKYLPLTALLLKARNKASAFNLDIKQNLNFLNFDSFLASQTKTASGLQTTNFKIK